MNTTTVHSAIELRQCIPVCSFFSVGSSSLTVWWYLFVSVDAVRFGIETLAPKFFNGQPPDFVVSGSNVGGKLASDSDCPLNVAHCPASSVNLGPGIRGSGTWSVTPPYSQ